MDVVIPGSSTTPPPFPVGRPDGRLGNGSLILLDPENPYMPWPSGIPADGTAVPNIAADVAAGLAGDVSVIAHNSFAGASGSIRRSSRGGYVVDPSATAGVNGAVGRLDMSADLRAYIQANRAQQPYISVSYRIVRAPDPTTTADPALARITPTSGNGLSLYLNRAAAFVQAGVPTVASGDRVGFASRVDGTTGFMAVAGAISATATMPLLATLQQIGPTTAGQVNKTGAYCTYSIHVALLGISGRTFDQQRALDEATYFYDVVNAGGRYYGDS